MIREKERNTLPGLLMLPALLLTCALCIWGFVDAVRAKEPLFIILWVLNTGTIDH